MIPTGVLRAVLRKQDYLSILFGVDDICCIDDAVMDNTHVLSEAKA